LECEAIPEIFVKYGRKNYKRLKYTKNQLKIFFFLGVSHLVKHLFLYSENPQKMVAMQCICPPTVYHDCGGGVKLK